MKKILVIAALAIFSFANAQKGSVLVMGSIGYNSQNSGHEAFENNYHYFSFSPKVGYQFHENWTAGLTGAVSTVKNEDGTVYESKTNTFSLGGFLRYSKPLNQTFSAYADLGMGYQNSKVTTRNGLINTTNKGNGFYVGITPAIFINVNKGFGLNFNIGGLNYGSMNFDNDNNSGTDRNSFDFTFGQAFSVGISKNF
ncbi:outer membrane protein with beta-barrel domain [Flavobacterium sp. 90]|uniref:outer membrane beta-barrel protein n=1 Tax=unclassified Flavobacterium TaxID=196869 RepID=UPI000EB0E2F8|nr:MULTISPECIES: outer membrane beta-barrel protein [unclassified Flavobacterium]RKR09652.1 outer membrane protein with beta-barrel domain [Flavobacterium sp. 81]TCK53437.1 outer membrane protein with beta-barrel domain [Flavobacterium sp. 90]